MQCPIQRSTDFTNTKALQARQNDFHNFRQYQYMLSIFSSNINQIVKIFKDCLGQMQNYPKYSVSKQIQEQSQRLLSQCYQQIMYKLSKQCLGRNEAIIKKRQAYSQQYYRFVGQTPNIQNIENNRTEKVSFFQLAKLLMAEQQKQQRLLSKSHRRKTISTTPNNERLTPQIQIFKSYQVNLSSAVISKTVASYHSQPHQYFIRATRSNISRTQRERSKRNHYQSPKGIQQQSEQLRQKNGQQLVFLGKEIVSQPHPTKRVRPTQRKYTNYCSQSTSSSKLHFNDIILVRENQKKAIDQIQQLHLRTKNLQISNYVCPNLSQIQSYRPKVKRWQRNFN